MKTLAQFLLSEDMEEKRRIADARRKSREARGGKGAEGNAEPLNPEMHRHQGNKEKQRRIKQGKAPNMAKGPENAIVKVRKAPTSTDIVRTQARPDSARNKTDRIPRGGALAKRKPSPNTSPETAETAAEPEVAKKRSASRRGERPGLSPEEKARRARERGNRVKDFFRQKNKGQEAGESKSGNLEGSQEIKRGQRS